MQLLLTGLGVVQMKRGRLDDCRWLLWLYVGAVAGAFVANQAGWVAAEVGRQPWVVYGLLRTSDGLSKAVQAGQVLWSILLFSTIYLLLFAVWVNVLHTKIGHGPDDGTGPHDGDGAGHDGQAAPPTGAGGLVAAASERVDPSADSSLTSARQAAPEAGAR